MVTAFKWDLLSWYHAGAAGLSRRSFGITPVNLQGCAVPITIPGVPYFSRARIPVAV